MNMNLFNDDILSDNTQITKCEQCHDCINWSEDGNNFQNKFDKSNCNAYPYPDFKPAYVINNTGPCEFYEKEE